MYQLVILTLLGFIAATAERSDAEKLNGAWMVTSFTFDGESHQVEADRGEFRIEGNKVTLVQPNGATTKGTFSIRSKADPKEYDIQMEPPRNGTPVPAFRGIYEIDGDTLKMCFTWDPGTERPKNFAALKGKLNRVTVYKRK